MARARGSLVCSKICWNQAWEEGRKRTAVFPHRSCSVQCRLRASPRLTRSTTKAVPTLARTRAPTTLPQCAPGSLTSRRSRPTRTVQHASDRRAVKRWRQGSIRAFVHGLVLRFPPEQRMCRPLHRDIPRLMCSVGNPVAFNAENLLKGVLPCPIIILCV